MVEIVIHNDIPDEIKSLAEAWHEKYEASKNIQCDFKKFHLLAKENAEIVGILIGYTAFSNVYVNELIVKENFRRQGIGKKLLQRLEQFCNGKNYSDISLVTNEFQAPDFYKKCGYALEFVRENKHFPAFSKYFFVKWLNSKSVDKK